VNATDRTKIYLTAINFFAAFVLASAAHATMPQLTPEPKPATPEACRAWVTSQSDDAMDMWGIQEDGTSSPEVAVQRLTASCLGQPVPEIVGFGSSIGVDIHYCELHPKQKICLDTAEFYAAEILANLKKNTVAEPDFQSFPVGQIYKGRTHFPDFRGRDREFARFRTRIRNGLKEGPDFAGRYSIVEIGCGTGCRRVFIADNRTGKVFDFPRGVKTI
jgi:hypothetical protein